MCGKRGREKESEGFWHSLWMLEKLKAMIPKDIAGTFSHSYITTLPHARNLSPLQRLRISNAFEEAMSCASSPGILERVFANLFFKFLLLSLVEDG